MTRQYFVIAKETCQRCGGDGVICPHAEFYRRYFEFAKTLTGLDHNSYSQKQDAWIREQGFDPACMPLEEVECPDCRGDGYIESRVPLTEALIELIEQNTVVRCLISEV